MAEVDIHDSWKAVLQEEFDKSYFQDIITFLKERKKQGATIYPPGNLIFNAFNTTPFENVKVVILGQDPYHGQGEAHGLCFSVQPGVRIPPSLRNIYKELLADLGYEIPRSGDLTKWAEQGVFLLNAILTVEHKSPASHKNKGWETFTDAVIKLVSDKKENVVFILWGAFAKSKKKLIDESKHLILEAPHPAAEVYAGGKAGFFESKPFSKANVYLSDPVNWKL
jgi:uracil-DNA glycosylase